MRKDGKFEQTLLSSPLFSYPCFLSLGWFSEQSEISQRALPLFSHSPLSFRILGPPPSRGSQNKVRSHKGPFLSFPSFTLPSVAWIMDPQRIHHHTELDTVTTMEENGSAKHTQCANSNSKCGEEYYICASIQPQYQRTKDTLKL